MRAWVIKRDDGKHFICNSIWSNNIALAVIYTRKKDAMYTVKNNSFCVHCKCKPITITIIEGDNEENSYIIDGRFNGKQYIKNLETENKILEKALALACEKLANVYGECPYSNMNLDMPDYCEEHCGENEKLLCWDIYFKSEAKEELQDE